MDTQNSAQEENLQTTIDKFWEVIPHLWKIVRKHIHEQAVEEHQITLAQFHILRHIQAGKDSVSKLAEVGHISRPAISRGVDNLVSKGFVSRETDHDDRRHILLSLTPEGSALLDELFGNTRKWMMRKIESLTQDELENIIQGLDAFQKTFIE